MANVRFVERNGLQGDYAVDPETDPDLPVADPGLAELKAYLAAQPTVEGKKIGAQGEPDVPSVDTQASSGGQSVGGSPVRGHDPFGEAADRAISGSTGTPPAPPPAQRPSRKDELQGLMDEYSRAQKLSANRHQQHGAEALMFSDASLRQPYVNSFKEWNDAPVKDIEGRMAVAKQSNDLETQTSKIDYSREYGDPNSDVSRAARTVARKQLNMPEIPESMSAEDIEKILPGIKLLSTQYGLQDRNIRDNGTKQEGIRQTAITAEEKRKLDRQKFEEGWSNKFKQEAISDYQKFRRVQEMNKGGMNKAIVISGLAQRDSTTGGGGGGGGNGTTLSNVLGDQSTPYLTVKPGMTPSKIAGQEVEKFNGAMAGAYDAMLQIQNIMNGSFPFPGEAAWRDLQANAYNAAQAQNQIDKNGVMNFGDFFNVMQELGKPGSFEQMAEAGVAPATARHIVQDTLNRMKRRYEKYVDSQGFMPSGTPGVGGATGNGSGGGKSGNTNLASPNAIDTAARSSNPELPPVVAPARAGAPQQQTQSAPWKTSKPDGEYDSPKGRIVVQGGMARFK